MPFKETFNHSFEKEVKTKCLIFYKMLEICKQGNFFSSEFYTNLR